MADIYTLQLKRIAQALQNLADGLIVNGNYYTSQNVASKLDSKIPDGMASTDYDTVAVLKTDIDALLKKHAAWIEKFRTWDQSKELADPLDMLGKVFYQFGTPIREAV